MPNLKHIDYLTRSWIRGPADERAALRGCRFDDERAQHPIDFAARYLRLYEGEQAGQPLIARDWQLDAARRLFGWVTPSDRWGREIRRFNRASIWVPKKNKKSPTIAWWALYLLCADGELGQKVFFGAKDGSQARDIAGKHAVEMVLASPDLSAECSINRNEMRITHEPTRSVLKPMSSSDSRTQQSKEGLNGSLLIDETHVVDEDFIRRLSRMGISRSEPLHIEVSTAGKDPDCYGKKQYDLGKMVESGQVDDDSFFFACFEAPQKLSDSELAADPIKYGKMANPAWGHTVHETEYLADYHRSRLSITELADFKTYRLNIWQRSANPWIRASDWDACGGYKDGRQLTLADFAGEPCWAGFDKSKTRDMTALVLTFRDPQDAENYYQFPFFWLPEQTARDNDHAAPFVRWAAEGLLKLIRGEVIEDGPIEEFVAGLHEQHPIQEIYYDRTFASDITLRLEQQQGITRVEFPQTTAMFAGPIDEYERRVIQGNLRHANHSILTWQAGHCQVHTDSKGRKTLIKPRHGDIKKIDGMVAGVMSLFGAMNGANKRKSVYSRRGVITL